MCVCGPAPVQEQCDELLRAAAPLPCTFHRAFDCVSAPEEALDAVIRLGFTRLLTSGLSPTAIQVRPMSSYTGDRSVHRDPVRWDGTNGYRRAV